MAYNIDVNINFGSASSNFQTLIDNNAKLQATIDNLSKTIQDFGQKTTTSNNTSKKAITDYTGSYKNLAKEITETRKQLISELETLEKLRKSRNASTKDINDQVSAVNKLDKELKQQVSTLNQYNKALGNTSSQAKQTNSALSGLIKGFNSLGAVLGISFGAYGAFRILSESIKTIAEFDLAQKKLQSILAETNDGMKVIAASAVEVGKSSIFGAKGVTDLQIELAKMGFAKEDIIAMQGAIVNLATATQEELAPSAEVVANIIRSFQLTAGDATMVVDTMGKAFNDSALDLANFREAIKYVAPIAKQANFTFAETVSLLEQLSNAGIKGSLAGTGLTNIISRLGNENSKFVKTLGRTVNGFDDFLKALIELKSRGANLTDIFQLVDRRAAATFSILLEGVDTVEQFKAKLNDASGVMKEQAAVQLESISFKAKLLKENWKAMIIEMDESTNVITGLAKSFLDLGNSIITALGDPAKQVQKLVQNVQTETSNINNLIESGFVSLSTVEKQIYKERLLDARDYYTAISDLETKYQQSVLEVQQNVPIGGQGVAMARIKIEFSKQLEEIKKQFKTTDEVISSLSIETTNKALKPYVDEFTRLTEETKNLDEAWLIQVGRLTKLRDAFPKASLNAQIYQKAIEAITNEYDRLNKTGLNVGDKDSEQASKDRISKLRAELELQKQIALNSIKLTDSADDHKRAIIEETYLWDKKIANLTIQNAEEKKLALIKIEQEWQLAIKDLGLENYKKFLETKAKEEDVLRDFYKTWIDLLDMVAKEQKDLDEETSKSITKNIEDWFATYDKNATALRELQQKNPLLGIISKPPSMEQLGEMTPEQLDELKMQYQIWGESIKTIEDSITSLTDKWVESFDKIVDARNNMVDEAQQALETELQLAEQGFASNVTLKRKELEEAKRLRQEAIADQMKAQKIQLAIDSATQISALTTTIANYFKATSPIPIVGVGLAIAAITTMFGIFSKFKALAAQQAAIKYETGGEVGGRRHSAGGTMIEAERGEYVINRKSTMKHKKMIEAINNDDQFSLNKLYINGLKSSVLSAHVSLDDSEDLKAIRKALEKQGKEVSYFGNYRIEKIGNITTRIMTN